MLPDLDETELDLRWRVNQERDLLIERHCYQDLILAIFRLAILDVARGVRSRRANAALRFLRSPWAGHLAELAGLDKALHRSALRVQRQAARNRTRKEVWT